MLIGYIFNDTENEQANRLKEFGCQTVDASLTPIKNRLAAGDTLVVTHLGALDMKPDELSAFILYLLSRKRADLLSLDDKLDTRGPFREYLVATLSAIARAGSAVAIERRMRGTRRAKASGKKLGRPFKMTVARFKRAQDFIRKGELNARSARILMGISKTTYYRWKKQILDNK